MKTQTYTPRGVDYFTLPVSYGDLTLETFTLSESELSMIRMRAMLGNGFIHDLELKANYEYTRLLQGRTIWMSDTPNEIHTNREFMSKAKGDVLVGGLGMGITLMPLLENPAVTSITVVEKNKDVIELWKRSTANLDVSKVTVEQGDIFTWGEPKKKDLYYDTIYFDIWPTVCADWWPHMKTLHRTYKHFLRNGGWKRCWMENAMRDLWREDYG